MNIVTRKLIFKELFINRSLIIGTSAAGVLSILITMGGHLGFNIGVLTWMTGLVAHGVMLAMYGVVNERKENSLLFVLSLPISTAEYVRAKQFGLFLCFFIPWLISSAAAVALIGLYPGGPHGLLPFLILMCVFFITNFSLVLCGALHARSEAVMTGVIVVTNMAVTLFIFLVGGLTSINKSMWGPTAEWNEAFWFVLTIELCIFTLAFVLPLFVAARRRDYL